MKAISFDKNSSFYNQNDRYKFKSVDSEKFIQDYMKKLFSKNTNSSYFFPKTFLKSESFKTKISNILDFIWNNFFNQKKMLSSMERKVFIDISYILIPHYLIKDYDSYNRTCKDGIDRAGSENSLEFALLLLMSLQDNPNVFIKYIPYFDHIIFTDALFIRFREIKKERLDRYLESLSWIINSFKNDPYLSIKIRNLTHIKNFSFHYSSDR